MVNQMYLHRRLPANPSRFRRHSIRRPSLRWSGRQLPADNHAPPLLFDLPLRSRDTAPPVVFSAADIVRYYDSCSVDYALIWNLHRDRALHYGFWENDVRNMSAALARQNDWLAARARIGSDDRVLDAGCGVGGSAIHLARRYGCSSVGISLSRKQIRSARRHAVAAGLRDRVRFAVRDFANTGFPDGSFSVVWAIESACHAPDKQAFVREAWRLLSPGGRLIVADGFCSRPHSDYSEAELELMRSWLHPWAVADLSAPQAFRSYMVRAGFASHSIEAIDVTHLIRPSARLLHRRSVWTWLPAKMLHLARMRTTTQHANHRAARKQWEALERNLWCYQVFVGEKL